MTKDDDAPKAPPAAPCDGCAVSFEYPDSTLKPFHDGARKLRLCTECLATRRYEQDEDRKARTAANNARTGLAKNQLRRERARQRARAERKRKSRERGRATA